MKQRKDEDLNNPRLYAVDADGNIHSFRCFLDDSNILYFDLWSLNDSGLRMIDRVDNGKSTRQEEFWQSMTDDEYAAFKQKEARNVVVNWFTNCCLENPPKGYLPNYSAYERALGAFLGKYCADSIFTYCGRVEHNFTRGCSYCFSVSLTQEAADAFRTLEY